MSTRMTIPPIQLTEADWGEIWHALDEWAEELERMADLDTKDPDYWEEYIEHVRGIRERIGAMGCDAYRRGTSGKARVRGPVRFRTA